jgi:Fic family protein
MGKAELLEILDDYKALGTEHVRNFDLCNGISFTYNSTAIEGSALSEEETFFLITEGLAIGGKRLIDQCMVMDHHEALQFTSGEAGADAPVTPGLVRDIGYRVMRTTGNIYQTLDGRFDSSKGEYRLCMVRAGNRYFMEHPKVPAAVDELCLRLEDSASGALGTLEAYDLAFDAHYWLVNIHPFADGNGRTSRLLMNFILLKNGLPLAFVFFEDKPAYIGALEDSHRAGDTYAFREFMYSQQEKRLAQVIKSFKDAG